VRDVLYFSFSYSSLFDRFGEIAHVKTPVFWCYWKCTY